MYSVIQMEEYTLNSGTNAWNFNTNGNLNSNNRFYTRSVRPVLEFCCDKDILYSLPLTPEEWTHYYKKCRQHKRRTPAQVIFEINYEHDLLVIMLSVDGEYIPKRCIAFIIRRPRIREVIAADFSDRIVQTMFVGEVGPLIEEMLDPHSYSCRVGKGALRAVQRLAQLMKDHPNGIVFKLDFQGFFPNFDTALWVDILQKEIIARMPACPKRDMLVYLARIIYLTRSQDNVIKRSLPYEFDEIEPEKRMCFKEGSTALPIGNVSSQFLINFATTFCLKIMRNWFIQFAHYTDDTGGVVDDFHQLAMFIGFYEKEIKEKYHFILHPKKRYFQPVKHGVNFLCCKITGTGELLPSARLIHNSLERIRLFVIWSQENRNWMLRERDFILSVINSYFGLFRHMHSYHLRCDLANKIKNSPISEILYFDENKTKSIMRRKYDRKLQYKKKNRIYRSMIRKRAQAFQESCIIA